MTVPGLALSRVLADAADGVRRAEERDTGVDVRARFLELGGEISPVVVEGRVRVACLEPAEQRRSDDEAADLVGEKDGYVWTGGEVLSGEALQSALRRLARMPGCRASREARRGATS
jgi:hypothetical protein